MLEKKKYLFFDLDGTLIDSVGIWNDTDRALIRTLGGAEMESAAVGLRRDRLLAEFKEAGNPYEAYCAWLGAHYGSKETGAELLKRRDAIAREKLARDIAYKPGAADFLKAAKAKGYILAIGTTTRKKNIDIYRAENENIRRAALLDEYFDCILTREDVSAIKPDPEIYEKLRAHFHAEPEECFIFEDSLVGVEAARNAGIEAAGIYDKYSVKEEKDIRKLVSAYFQNWEEAAQALGI